MHGFDQGGCVAVHDLIWAFCQQYAAVAARLSGWAQWNWAMASLLMLGNHL
jgi:hypothetical protein